MLIVERYPTCEKVKDECGRKLCGIKQEPMETKDASKNMKKCSGCGEVKARSEFSKDRTKKDGLYHLCKVCRSAYRRKNKDPNKADKKSVDTELVCRDNKDVGVLAIVYAVDECGVCNECGKSLMGFIPGYLHGQPVCKDCVIGNLKRVFE